MVVRSWLVSLALVAPSLRAEGLTPPLSERQTDTARKALAAFKAHPKGPFYRIRWYCKDGSVLPPEGVPCKEKGGGIQHAELSTTARQLWDWGIHAGTILAAEKPADLIDAATAHHRLKELVLEKFLMAMDQGWIYRKAINYRGARQIEDEEKAGRQVLTQLLSDPEWLRRNYFLACQLVDTLPHGVANSDIKRIRALAAVAADADPRFQGLRAKIHSYPGPEDLASVRDFIQSKSPTEAAKKPLAELASLLDQQQNPAIWITRLEALRKQSAALGPRIDELTTALRERSAEQTLEAAARLSMAIRAEVLASKDGRRNLDLLDLNQVVQEKAFGARIQEGGTRLKRIEHLLAHFEMALGAGLISDRQFAALNSEAARLRARNEIPAEDYRTAMRYLGRSIEWMRATAARDFGPVSTHYAAVEPAAGALVDHVLRGSAALATTVHLESLLADADRAAGIRHRVLGQVSSAGVVGLNPGVSLGKLAFLKDEHAPVDPRAIYVIPGTASDLKPVAGILTLDSGNMLSHAQLLAANLGIPNATVPSSLRAALEKAEGRQILYAVTPRGMVILKEVATLTEDERRTWIKQAPTAARERIVLDTSRLNLADRRLHKLTDLSTRDSGVICGPKAANLGQLASYFPDKVAPGLVVPFGIFHSHITRPGANGRSLQQEISAVVAESERLRDSGADPLAIQNYVYPQLKRFREMIENLPLDPAFERELREAMTAMFGADGSYGVYIRSDTNAEDLPQFTGAGLNLTLPNEVGVDRVLKAIRRVWASPFAERAWDWRSRALKGTDKVYPSVIVMRTVASDKSGVIATVDLDTSDQSFTTVNVSEGVSAVVDGGVAESLLLAPDGTARLLQQCRATYRKVAGEKGGFDLLPPLAADELLPAAEIAQLRAMVAEVKRKYPPARAERGGVLPWDIEFGFEKGQLRLFQIRPLARFQEVATLAALAGMEGGAPAPNVRLSEPPAR